ncbi:SusC/RagA family TonB-linked outer membrane protein [Solitalea lacus]|uniref:SusC/RagA family TonB-linked outer membrane protein n=1 Tax=Solitalea lacus TaxID=2911172 RepID=UPI001EDAD531|nr:SusC/RagA family TonB-linked outer membrane protein [Solitalea lacus]UKJ09247.1 SusC/RagA family TonB-linked outer membrane protein [Solitalea lacus]
MKITAALMLIFMTCVYGNGKAQKVSLSLRNAKLEYAFKEISKQTKYKFLYNDELLKNSRPINLNIENESLPEALSKLLSNNNMVYRIFNETISISASTESVAIVDQVKGTVRDEFNQPLPGATVSVKGTSVATVTNAQGEFTLNAPPNATLVVRFLGYKDKEVTIGNQKSFTIKLDLDAKTLNAVSVVATGYQNIDRKLFTGAATKINAKDVERAGVPDISRMLEGQVAGVSIQNVSGTFGAAPKIRVRGATSISGDNKPLWVVDGIILEDIVNISNEALSTGDPNTLIGSSVAGLNPDDIEGFSILKDAAATAMYGARAMNGVIVVTTKKGKQTEGAPQINYSSTFTSYLKPSYEHFDMMNSAEQMAVLLEMERKGGFSHGSSKSSANGGIFVKMYDQMYNYDPTSDSYGLRNDQASRNQYLERYADANTNWFDILFKNSLLQEHSLSYSSGSSKSQTYASTSFTSDGGQTIGDKVKRFTANLRTNFKLSESFSGELLFNGSIRDQRTPGTLGRTSNSALGSSSRNFDINPYNYALNTSRLMTPYDKDGNLEYFRRNFAPFNILNELENNYITLGLNELKVQAGFKYKIIPKLTYSADGSYRYASTNRKHYVMENSNMVGAYQAYGNDPAIIYQNPFLFADPSQPWAVPSVVLPDGGFYNTNTDNLVSLYARQNLEYDATFNEKHRLNVFGSMEVRSTDRQSDNFSGVGYQYSNSGLVHPDYKYFQNAQYQNSPYYGMGYTKDRFAAMMLRAAYAYADKYSFNFTTRVDRSNMLGKTKAKGKSLGWLPTWNVSGSWNIDQEKFFNQNGWFLSGARVRGTYGLVANLGNARNKSVLLTNGMTSRIIETDKEQYVQIASLENADLTWEKLHELNIGSDLSFFNNKVDVTLDWYKRNIFDLLGPIITSGIGGQVQKIANYASMSARGFEATIAGYPIRNENFKWRTSFNFAHNENKITDLKISPNWLNLVRAEGGPLVGHPQRGLYSVQFDGLSPNYGYPTFISETGARNTTKVDFESTNVDYLKYHGPVDPTWTGGFYNQVGYKNFTLSFLFNFSMGNYVRMAPVFTATLSDDVGMSREWLNRWMVPGDEKQTNIPTIMDPLVGLTSNPEYAYSAYNNSDARVAKGDFVRLKNISLSYRVPKRLSDRLRMRNLEFTVLANNIALLYSDKKLHGADPEFFGSGGVALPVPKQFTFSLKTGF